MAGKQFEKAPLHLSERAAGAEITVLAEYAARLALSLILGLARIYGTLSPFALCFVAVSGPGLGGLCALAGAVLGYTLSGDMIWALKYISVCVLIYTVSSVFHRTEAYSKRWFMPSVAAAVTGFISVGYLLGSGWTLTSAAMLAADLVISFGCTWAYGLALSPWTGRLDFTRSDEAWHTISVLALVSSLLAAAVPLELFGVMSAGRAAAVLIVMLFAFKGGAGTGGASGAALGMFMDAAGGGAPFYSAVYGVSALVSGVFSKFGRLPFALVFILTGAVLSCVSMPEAVTSALYETFVASAIFVALPRRFLTRIEAFLPSSVNGYGVLRSHEYMSSRIELAAAAFRDLYSVVSENLSGEKNDEDVGAVFDRAADTVCRGCKNMHVCWERDYSGTVDALNNASAAMMERGRLEPGDLPPHFSKRCANTDGFVAAVNGELSGMIYRRQYRSRLKNNRAAAYDQYADMSAILHGFSVDLGKDLGYEPVLEERLRKYLRGEGLSADTAVFRCFGGRLRAEITGGGAVLLRHRDDWLNKVSAVLGVRLCTAEKASSPQEIVLLEAEPLCASVGIASLGKRGGVSGDRGAYFKTDEGTLYVILSDGMGTGEAAAAVSDSAVRIIERFLRSGVAPETAVRILNDLILLKNECDTGCTTVDLVSIDLFSGRSLMFKYGAAPSYLVTAKDVRRIRGKSFAAGLGLPPANAPDRLSADLRPGSMAVLVSDGITAGADDIWLMELLADNNAMSAKELARAVVKASCERFGGEDDMTAFVISISERK